MSKTYFVQSAWFLKIDSSGHKIETWCKKLSEYEVSCLVCNKTISCVSKGFAALTQHQNTSIHKKNIDVKLNKTQMLLACSSTSSKSSNPSKVQDVNYSQQSSSSSIKLYNRIDAVLKAEIIWALKSVQCNMSLNSCDDMQEIFKAMFPCSIADEFNMGHTKLSYLITEALGPYFYKQLTEQVKESFYTLLFDETTNAENKKELQIMLRFWSEEERKVVTHHLKTMFLGHAKADKIVSSIRSAMQEANLSADKLLMIGSDGPNINKAVKRMLSSQLNEERGIPLLDIGSCNIHIVHTAFLKGIEQLGEECTELIIDIYNFFKKFPSRWEDFESIQLKLGVSQNRFKKHISTRWLTLAPAAERLIEQWPAIEFYFFKFIPSKAPDLMSTPKFKRIAKTLKIVDIKLECEFVVESGNLFTKFTRHFQKSEPLIHLLSDQLENVLKVIAGRITKKDMINVKEAIKTNQLLPLNAIDCCVVKNSTLQDKEKFSFLIKVQKHYVAAFNYLVSKYSSPRFDFLPLFKSLQPAQICNTESVERIYRIADVMPFKDFDKMSLKDEWRLLQLDYGKFDVENSKKIRIDEFWGRILYSEEVTYPHITKVIKAALCLSHGNSDVERGFCS